MNHNKKLTLRATAALGACVAAGPLLAAGATDFTSLNLPNEPAQWTVSSSIGSPATLAPSAKGDGVAIAIDKPADDTVITVKLKKPVSIPATSRRVGMWFYTSQRFTTDKTAGVRFLLRDATGVGYSYAQYGSSPIPGAWSYIECPRLRGGEMGRLDEVLIRVESGLQHHLPVAPLQFEGVTLHVSSKADIKKPVNVEIGSVFADSVAREKSKYYWQSELGQRYVFGEVPFGRAPFIMAGDILDSKGDYTITWQARSDFYGRPVAQGQWTVPNYDNGVAAKFQSLEMPLTAKGQYWITYKIKEATRPIRFAANSVKVVRGELAQMPVLSGAVRPLGALLVLNPQRPTNVYTPGELTTCKVRVWRPDGATPADTTLTVSRSKYPSDAIGTPEKYAVEWAAGADYCDISLPLTLDAATPMQQLDLSLKSGARELDHITQLVGQQELLAATPWTNRDKVLRYADIFENGNHLLCCAEWDPRYTQNTDLAKFEAWIEDVKRQNVNTIELFPRWPDIEPMPGVYWWDQVDARLALIAKHGLHAMINVDCTRIPVWMEEEGQADEEGMVNGLWGRGGNDVLKSPSSRALHTHYGEFLTQLALRYRNNPTLVAYSSLSIFFDHFWADHPWMGHYVDYSKSSEDGFRRYLRDVRGFSLPDLSTRWHTKLGTWDDVQLPRTDLFLGIGSIEKPDPRPEWRDFLDFRTWCQESFFSDLVAGTIRKYDDRRPIGTHGRYLSDQYYKDHDMFVCAGSSEGSLDGYTKPYPFPKRAESIQMSFYTPYYTAMCMSNLLSQNNLNVQHFWMPHWRWDESGNADRTTGTQSLAGWLALFQGDLGKATVVHAASEAPPVVGLLYSKASIRYGIRSFHTPRLDDYQQLADRATAAPHKLIDETATADELSVLPCIVVDPTARILPMDAMQRLVTYVKNGGKLVLAPTGGNYSTEPSDGEHVLTRLLGLPVPKSTWNMSPEFKLARDYTAFYPWDVTGQGNPGQQSLGQAGQTASAKTDGSAVFASGRTLVFRLGPYSMYNRDTWGDWAHTLPYFIFGRYREQSVPGGTVLASFSDGGPAATLHQVGNGQVVMLWGTPDWFNWKDELADIAKWAAPAVATPKQIEPQPYTITPDTFRGFIDVKDATRWAVLRNEGTGWTSNYPNADKQKTAVRTRGSIAIPGLTAAKYRVRDITPLLSQGYDAVLTREQIATQGISADLIAGETRLFRLDPLP